MSLASWTLFAYCILVSGTHVHAINCKSCASPSLKENWEVTGLPAIPQNVSNFFTDDCISPDKLGDITCASSGCFFGSFASISGEYLVIRGCMDEFMGDSGYKPDTATVNCEYATSNRAVSFNNKAFNAPLIGWWTCSFASEDPCNSKPITKGLLDTESEWVVNGEKCKTPANKRQCISCEHFDGVGRCHHNSKTVCPGNYCTKTVGKLNNRWFEIRGCTPTLPFKMQNCLSHKKTLIMEQVGSVINQSYWATNCVCEGDKCNSSTTHLISFSALFVCAMIVFKIVL